MDNKNSLAMVPKVQAAAVAYAVCLALALILGDVGIAFSADTVQAVSGAVMLLVAYFVPDKSAE